ncbi:hypothetical protein D3H64_01540 [Atopobacter sp. AH10]|uniref:hypothetical protein n=1 Tax=Atopobacter sp. AH10 TaxID=2315861 RepID=UPI000EF23DDD|nr:hypothetical protein [Atopobacter sp. AH10]RLK64032.1 hypothetical protein D3H64_01540 [Atopobacter sp. AH10]
MKELNALKEKVLASARQEAEQKVADTEERCASDLTAQKEKMAQYILEQKELINRREQMRYERLTQKLTNQKNQDILAHKRSLLEDLFQQSYEVMANWSSASLAEFIKEVLLSLDESHQYVLSLGERSAKHLSAQDQELLAKQFPQIKWSEKQIEKRAGFVLSDDMINLNYFFDDLLSDLRKEFGAELARKAFES